MRGRTGVNAVRSGVNGETSALTVSATEPGSCLNPATPGTSGGTVGDSGDFNELYASLSARLERIVRMDVRAPRSVIEDACQVAWGQLVRYRDSVQRDSALSWLATTAIHEAFALLRRQNRFYSLDEAVERQGDAAVLDTSPAADEICELTERLEGIRALSHRQQQMLWLHGLGYTYREIAATTGCTKRTVERQLLRAKRKMRALAATW
jgi:RNA polymerase sigma factor (sigma-70 family)